MRRTLHIALSALVFSLAGVVGKILPGANQDSWPIILFCLPVWLGLCLGLGQLLRDRK